MLIRKDLTLMKYIYKCLSCGYENIVSKRKAKYLDGLPCVKCKAEKVIPLTKRNGGEHGI